MKSTSISALLRAIGLISLVIALALVSQTARSQSDGGCRCAAASGIPGALAGGCCSESDGSGSASPHGPGCGTDTDDRCACPSSLDAFTINGVSGPPPPPLSGTNVAESVRVPETASQSEIFRPPLA